MARHLSVLHPPLTATIVSDDQRLWARIDQVLTTHPELIATARTVVDAQRELRGHVDDDGWRAYGSVEEEHNHRAATAHVVLVRWAFHEGFREGRLVGEGGR